MYDELISSLRICGKINSANDNCIAFHDGSCEAEPVCMYELMDNAADAIEELVCKEKFHAFLWNTIQPNEMEQYISMYNSGNIPQKPPKEE